MQTIKSELKKITWPGRKKVLHNVSTVIGSCLLLGAFVWLLDTVFLSAYQAILTLIF